MSRTSRSEVRGGRADGGEATPSGSQAIPARMVKGFDLRPRLIAAGIHLSISAAVAGLAAILVFALWYPGAFRSLAGGRDLFLLVSAVDVVIGPLLTFAVFNRAKGDRHLRRDLTMIGLLQLAALAYGMHTVYVARPVAMVFEVDRFRMVTANNVVLEELPKASPEFRELSLTGPLLIAARRPEAGAERQDAVMMGLSGIDVGQRPTFWQAYAKAQDRVVTASKPISELLERYPQRAAKLRDGLKELKASESTSRFLPVMARRDFVAVLDPAGNVLGYLPFDGFL